jgi:hypothetical protein
MSDSDFDRDSARVRRDLVVSNMSADFYNEMYDSTGTLRPHYRAFAEWLAAMPPERLERKRVEADTPSTASASPSPSMARNPAPNV